MKKNPLSQNGETKIINSSDGNAETKKRKKKKKNTQVQNGDKDGMKKLDDGMRKKKVEAFTDTSISKTCVNSKDGMELGKEGKKKRRRRRKKREENIINNKEKDESVETGVSKTVKENDTKLDNAINNTEMENGDKKKKKRKRKKRQENVRNNKEKEESVETGVKKTVKENNTKLDNAINNTEKENGDKKKKKRKRKKIQENVRNNKEKEESVETGVKKTVKENNTKPDNLMNNKIEENGDKKKKRKRKKRRENTTNNKEKEESVETGVNKTVKENDTKPDNLMNNKIEENGDKKKKRKRKLDNTVSNEEKDEGAVKKIKIETSAKDDNTEEKKEDKKKKKRRRKKRKLDNTVTNEEKDENSERPVKKIKKMNDAMVVNNIEEKNQTAVKKVESKNSKKQTPILHSFLTNPENKDKIKTVWASMKKKGIVLEDGNIEVIKKPFTSCYIHNLLENVEFLEGLKEELDQIELIPKNNDLYKFHQTPDLKSVTSPFISRLRDVLYNDMRHWLIDVTGIPLNDTVDMGSSRYSYTDGLLCHDDELEGRSIAYILYLVPPWSKEDGGSLDLFNIDDNGEPKDTVRSLVPQHNGFAFFQVSPVSFHQVSEVLARDKTRLSINGWFHGPTKTFPAKNTLCNPSKPLTPIDFEEDEFYAWINPMYLDMEMQREMRHKFADESAMELENFLTDEAYEKLSTAFREEGLPWERTYPPNKRMYEILSPEKMTGEIKKCSEFLRSEAFFLVMSQLTGLKLHHMAPPDSDEEDEDEDTVTNGNSSKPTCQMEAQLWGHKCYTLVRDSNKKREALDAFLFVNVSKKWTEELGGHITYLAKHEDEELLTVVPSSNCLSLVYRDPHTMRFTKYINAASLDLGAQDSHYHSFGCVYYEK